MHTDRQQKSNNRMPNSELRTPNSKRIQPETIKLDGTNLIEASAGTGKTYTISSLFLRCITEGIRIDQILVVTFTIAATEELKNRIRLRLNQALLAIEQKLPDTDDEMIALILGYSSEKQRNIRNKIKHALSSFDEAAIFTIHSFCMRMLQENAFESGSLFDTELSADSRPLYEEIALDFWAQELYNAHPLFIRYLNDSKITPDKLIQTIHKTASQPDLVILPQKNEKTASQQSEIEQLYLDAFRTARDLLQNCEEEIKTLLESHPGINRRSYNKGTISKWLNAARQYLASSEPSQIFTADDDNSVYKFTTSRLWEKTKAGCDPPEHPFFDACQKLVETGSLFAQKWLALKRRFIEYSETELARRKQDAGVWFFDDLILSLHDALKGPGGESLVSKIRSRYQAALIDEFQDTDHVQYQIFRQIFQTGQTDGPALFLIGDPKQSIYAFRGADIFAYLKAIADAGENIFTLPTNWRSDPRLIGAVNTIFNRIKRPFWYPQIDFRKVAPRPQATDGFFINNQPAPPLTIQFIDREGKQTVKKTNLIIKGWTDDHLYRMAASDIVRLLSSDTKIGANGGRALTPGDIAVLARTNLQVARMQEALRELNVPSVLTSSDSVFDSPQAAELQEVLEAVYEPGNTGKIRNALSGTLFGLDSAAFKYLDENDTVYEKWLIRFQDWGKCWRNDSFIRMIRSVLACKLSTGVDEQERCVQTVETRQLSLDNGERRMTNLLQLIELLHEASVLKHLSPAGLIRHFERQCQTLSDKSKSSELRLESDARAVKLITVHKSKGLEFPVVYCPFLWDGKLKNDQGDEALFHDPDDNRQPKFDIGSEALKTHKQIVRTEEFAENLRLLYVALTRARHHCVVVWGAINDMQTSSLGYILHSQGAAADSPDELAKLAEYVSSLSDDAIQNDLNRLTIASQGAIKVETLDETESAPYQPATQLNYELTTLQTQRTLRRQWQISSFSALTAHGAELSPDKAEGRDHDSADTTPWAGTVYEPPEGYANARHPITLTGFGGGFQVGDMLHSIYENLDFQYDNRRIPETLVHEQLDRFGFDAARWQPVVSQAIEENIHTRLEPDEPELCLSKIAVQQRFNELEFLFPVADRRNPHKSSLTGRTLAAVFAKNDATVSQEYIDKLKRLSFAPLKGFLKGFIDLIFQYRGRWYVADYKSNFLGEQYQDYAFRQMAETMAEHHYYLQYHIYTVALHRLLSHRLKDYDYDSHFGQVYYLFLRGMSPQTGSQYGVFRDRPPAKLIKALSDLFGNSDGS